MVDLKSPLNDDHFYKIKEGLEMLDEAQRQIEQAIRAGVGVQEQLSRVTELRGQLTKLRNGYFPGRT